MKLKEQADKWEVTLTEAAERLGLETAQWNQIIPDILLADNEVIESAEEPEVIETVVELEPVETESQEAVAAVRALQTGIGFKTPAYLKAVVENMADLPAEYKLVKHLIDRYL